jgi:hypothetical protein
MILINPLTHPSVGSIEGFQNREILKNFFSYLLALVIAFGVYKLFFEKKKMPKENGDDKA